MRKCYCKKYSRSSLWEQYRRSILCSGERVLLLILPDTESKTGSQAYFRSKTVKQVPEKMEIPDGLSTSIIPFLELGRLVCCSHLKYGCFHVAIHHSHREFQRFTVNGCHYQFTVLCFGLSSAPCVFTKCMAVVVALLWGPRVQGFP